MSDQSNSEIRIAELRQRKQNIQQMLDSPGYKIFHEALNGMVRTRRQMAFSAAPEKLDDLVRVSSLMNQAAGLELAVIIPQVLLNDCNQDLESLVKEHNENE